MVTFVDSIIPDSPSDFGAILFWVLIIVLAIIVIIDIHTYLYYLYYRKTSKKIEKPQQKLNTIEPMKKSHEDRLLNIVEVRNKVDKLIEIHKM